MNLRSTLAEYEEGRPWSLAQAEGISSSLRGILGELEVMMNVSERETAEAIINHIKVRKSGYACGRKNSVFCYLFVFRFACSL